MSDQLRVIGAGFGRTGTLSMKSALETLGFGPCYHMYELLGHLEHAPSWVAAADGDTGALRRPLDGYAATVDWPGCVFWRELTELFPDAKVILSMRPRDRWLASFRETVGAVLARDVPRGDVPAEFQSLLDVSDRIVRDRSFGAGFDLDDAERVLASYDAHNRAVREGVASERLLMFDVADGWEPLCAFLEVRVPDIEFPNVNDREQFRQLFGLDVAQMELSEDAIAASQARFQEVTGG